MVMYTEGSDAPLFKVVPGIQNILLVKQSNLCRLPTDPVGHCQSTTSKDNPDAWLNASEGLGQVW